MKQIGHFSDAVALFLRRFSHFSLSILGHLSKVPVPLLTFKPLEGVCFEYNIEGVPRTSPCGRRISAASVFYLYGVRRFACGINGKETKFHGWYQRKIEKL